MGVELKVNPRHNSCRNRHPFAADRITVSRHGYQCQIAIVCDELHRRRIFVWIALAFDCQIAAIADDMRVCENSIATYDKASPDPALDSSGIPWRLIIWLHCRGGNPH